MDGENTITFLSSSPVFAIFFSLLMHETGIKGIFWGGVSFPVTVVSTIMEHAEWEQNNIE